MKKIYWDAYERETSASGNSYPSAKKDVLEQVKNGALIMAYSGHANPDGLSHEWVLRTKDVKEMKSSRLAFWLTMGCDVGPFDSAEESFGEELMLNEKGGVIGTLTSTRTTIRYALPMLPEGGHKILLRAWDMKNNSSTSELEFTVDYNLRPEFDVYCTSPTKGSTAFIITHNRPESELEFNVSVYDCSGKEMWVHTEKGSSSGSTYVMEWDLTSNAGQCLQPGIYLFRASVSSAGSKETTKTRKIVIMALGA